MNEVQVTGPINTKYPSDVYGTHFSKRGVGGAQTGYASLNEVYLIPLERREPLMIVTVRNYGGNPAMFWLETTSTDPLVLVDNDLWTLIPIGAIIGGGVIYKGNFSAVTGQTEEGADILDPPNLSPSNSVNGNFYICNDPGSFDFGLGSQTFNDLDYAIFDNARWRKLAGSSVANWASISGIPQVIKDIGDGSFVPATQGEVTAITGRVNVLESNQTLEGTDVRSTGETEAIKFLRENGDGTSSWQIPEGAGNVSAVNSPVNNDFAKWTSATTIEGRSYAEVKTDLSLDNVDNTDDASKPISTAQQLEIDTKKDDFSENTAFNKDYAGSGSATTSSKSDHNHSGVYEPKNTNIQSHISNTANPHSTTKTHVGLGNVDNISQKNHSYGESYFINFRDRVLDDAGTYFPNSGGYEFGKTKQLGIDRKMSLMMIPSGVKAGTLYSVKPQDGIGDFDVVRAGEATYVDEDGIIRTALANVPRVDYTDGDGVSLTESASTNLIERSEEFDNVYWTKSNSSVVSGFSAPDGSLNAFKLVESVGGTSHFISTSVTVSSGVDYTFSFFIKESGRSWIRLQDNSKASGFAYFNIATGVVGAIGAGIVTTSITPMADGWYKCSISYETSTTTAALRLHLAEADNDVSYTGDGTSGAYIFGAQLEELSYPASYIPTSGATASRIEDSVTGAGDSATFESVNSSGVLYWDGSFNDSTTVNHISISDGSSSIIYITTDDASDGELIVQLYDGSWKWIYTIIHDITTNFKIATRWDGTTLNVFINGVEISTSLATSQSTFSFSDFDRVNFGHQIGNDFYGKTKQVAVFNYLTDAEMIALTTP